jgi:hypothetical protein
MTHVGDGAYRLNFTSKETTVVAMVLLNNTLLDGRSFAIEDNYITFQEL